MASGRNILAAGLALLVGACGLGTPDQPSPRPRQPGARPATAGLPTSRETAQCHADLSREGVRYTPLPDQEFGGGCQTVGTVQLIDFGVPTTNLKSMRCGLARTFVGWARYGVAPAAYQILGSELVRIETFGTYACRNTIGTPASYTRLSGHAIANAVDVAAFVLADGRRITVAQGWQSTDPAIRQFLDVIRQSACKRFGTVLSPDYNAAHRDHLHLEDDHAGFCR